MNELDKTTRRIASFRSIDELLMWLHHHRCNNRYNEVLRYWNHYYADNLNNYRISVVKHLGKTYAVFQKQ